jgi:Domain of unknown function (DUF3883)
MRGGGGARRAGNAAEAYVAEVLAQELPECLVIPLQQDFGADLVIVDPTPDCWVPWLLVEVKSSKIRRRALSARLSPAEQELKDRFGDRYHVWRVLRIPNDKRVIMDSRGRHGTGFEVLSRGA